MITFEYVIKDEIGIHARPAGAIAKKSKEFESEITINYDGQSASVKRVMAVMALGIKHGEKVSFTVEGTDEIKAAEEMQAFIEENL